MNFSKIIFYLCFLTVLDISSAAGKLTLVDGIVEKMTKDLKSTFCVTLVSSNHKLKHDQALVVNFDLDVSDESLKSGLKTCPNLIIGKAILALG